MPSSGARTLYYDKAIAFKARPREKLIAIHSLHVGAPVDYFNDMLNVHLNRLGRQASDEHQHLLIKYEGRIAENTD
jgi:hypothetical protein